MSNVSERSEDGQEFTRVSLFARLKSTQPRDRELAWSEFMSHYGPIIAGFARRCGASPQDIDDIVQEVTRAFFAISGEFAYDPAKGRFRGWLKTCTVRTAIRLAGKNLRFQGLPLDEVPDPELAVEPVWHDVWERAIVAAALEELRRVAGGGHTYRAFEQYALLDRDAQEVAAELGISVDTVHQAKTRMSKKLREIVTRMRVMEE